MAVAQLVLTVGPGRVGYRRHPPAINGQLTRPGLSYRTVRSAYQPGYRFHQVGSAAGSYSEPDGLSTNSLMRSCASTSATQASSNRETRSTGSANTPAAAARNAPANAY